jgi:hypothetical protein
MSVITTGVRPLAVAEEIQGERPRGQTQLSRGLRESARRSQVYGRYSVGVVDRSSFQKSCSLRYMVTNRYCLRSLRFILTNRYLLSAFVEQGAKFDSTCRR